MNIGFIKVISLCLLLLCSASITFYCFFKQNTKTQPSSIQQAIMDERMSGVTAKRFSKDGQLQQILHIENWVHYKGEEFSHLQKPMVESFLSEKNNWLLNANKAIGYQKGLGRSIERLLLQGNVVIRQVSSDPEKQWRLVTEELNYYPKLTQAKNQLPVSIYNHSFVMHAVGIEADLTKQHIEFLSKVRSTYESP